MERFKRVFVVVMDSVGCGSMIDADQYGDVNSNKYGYIYGYWTSSLEQKNGLNYAWEIHRTSNVMLNATIDNNIVQGLRPVIEISKKVI